MLTIRTKEIFEKVPSIYKLVILASRRCIDINEGSPKLISTKLEKPLQIALEEIKQGKVTFRIKGE
ncbi:MAG: DNA-directed RNA polymerase subunit omega [Candidatus Omnitrophica bacterium]|nr:DNA-directed RNA polymerase subunit omega [Candidatus Omnitrophota bacterium]